MNLAKINQEIIALEFQFADATSQINLVALRDDFKGDKKVTAKSEEYVGISVEINKKLVALLEEREKSLQALLPVEVVEETTEETKPEEPETEAKPDEN